MKRNRRSYRVDSIAIAAAMAAIKDQEFLQASISYILREKDWLMREMAALDFKIVPSQGQTFIAKVPEKFGGADLFCDISRQHGVSVVNCSLYAGLPVWVGLGRR